MITINNERYAKDENEMIDTLFDGKGTACGTYVKDGGFAVLHDHQGKYIKTVPIENRDNEISHRPAMPVKMTKAKLFEILKTATVSGGNGFSEDNLNDCVREYTEQLIKQGCPESDIKFDRASCCLSFGSQFVMLRKPFIVKHCTVKVKSAEIVINGLHISKNRISIVNGTAFETVSGYRFTIDHK